MDDLKLSVKMMQEVDSLMQTVRIFSSDIGMQFVISKCAMLKMKGGKVCAKGRNRITEWRNDKITRR